ncbi:Solute carrier family 22 member 12 [Pteropus alecto]|uniref:Solute carrier family 22 member 12 n=1 Tax=Pteropus alecto TaxID=9402 RepID=L5KDK6_PTEAL|nr:Solute carrier family 22 member 12 [Pteropus alecto]
MNANNKQEQCRQFRQTRWQLLNSSDLTINSTELEMEPCLDDWTYDQSIFTSTIVTKWDLVCKSQSLRLWSRSIYLTGYVIGTPAVGYITDKWLSESARWMILSGKLDKALKELKKVAHINGRKDEENLRDEVLQSAMKEELIFLKNSSKKTKVMTSPVMCKTAFLLCFTRSRIEGVLILTNGMGSILGSTIVFTKQYFEHLPKILCGTLPIVASIYIYFLPETFNLPLPDTLQDMERR